MPEKTKYQYRFHNLISPQDPLASRPSRSKLTLKTEPPCPVSVLKHSPVFVFHNLIVLSLDPLARRPYPSKLTLQTQFPCPVSVLKHSPVFVFHNLIVPSQDPLAKKTLPVKTDARNPIYVPTQRS